MSEASILDKLGQVEERYEQLGRLLADPEVVTDYTRVKEYAQERSDISELVESFRAFRELSEELGQTRGMLDDSLDEEMLSLVQAELERLTSRRDELEHRLKLMLLPRDRNDERNVIVEIRAGTGGDEAALFAADLFRMYARYAEGKGWKTELLSTNMIGIGGFKEVIFEVEGRGAYSRLKHESGVHRVQRVPLTRWRSCQKPMRWKSRSVPKISGLMSFGQGVTADKESIPLTLPSA